MNKLKKRLNRVKAGWVDELPNVLWACRTSPRVATRETPFSLAYRIKAMVPMELKIPTNKVLFCDE